MNCRRVLCLLSSASTCSIMILLTLTLSMSNVNGFSYYSSETTRSSMIRTITKNARLSYPHEHYHAHYNTVGSAILASAFSDTGETLFSDNIRTNLYGAIDQSKKKEPFIGVVDNDKLRNGYDLVIIGGGPAGVAAGHQAAQMGQAALIIDTPKAVPDDRGVDVFFGGPTGLFSKALRDVAKKLNVPTLRGQGLDNELIWMQVRNQCVKLAQRNAETQLALLHRFKVDYVHGTAKLVKDKIVDGDNDDNENNGDNDNISVQCQLSRTGELVNIPAKKVLLATGSKAVKLGDIPFDGIRLFDADSINSLSHLPKSVVVVGSGIIAIEFARIFKTLGADVTVVVRSDIKAALNRMGLDEDIADELVRGLKQDNIDIYENTSISEFTKIPKYDNEMIEMKLVNSKDPTKPMHGGILKSDIYLSAIGRHPNVPQDNAEIDFLGLDTVGVEYDKSSGIGVNKATLQTSNKDVYAAGDCIGYPALASTSIEQARRAAACMFGEASRVLPLSKNRFPIGIWTIPEIGTFGLTLKDATCNKGIDAEEGIAYYDECLRGRVFAPNGLLKLVFDKSDGTIIGCHIIGDDACELIHFGMDLVRQKSTIFELSATIFTAVTFHELFKEAALNGDAKLKFGSAWQRILAELCRSMPRGEDNVVSKQQLKDFFDEIDADGSGELDAEELYSLFQKIGSEVTKATIANILRLGDVDGSGTIDFEEFESIVDAATQSTSCDISYMLEDMDEIMNDATAAEALDDLSSFRGVGN